MRMYTQYRGALCLGSIGTVSYPDLLADFTRLQEAFLLTTEENSRSWVCQDSHLLQGSNGSIWLFIGSEHKDYDDSMKNWIELIWKTFRCEGTIEAQYENADPQGKVTVYTITPDEISKESRVFPYEGYGFDGGLK